MTDFALTDNERASVTWIRLKAHLESRLTTARARNDGDLSEPETASLRGRIRELKTLIALGDSRPLVTGDTE